METPTEYTTQTDDQPVPIRDLRTEKRFFVDNVILRGYGPQLGVYGIAVYTALCMHANLTTQTCYPSHRTIAEMLDCSVSKVKQSIKTLKRLKLIETAPRYDAKNERQTSNLYTLLDPPMPPVTTDTPPQYREKTAMNNPPLDQSSLNKEPAAPDSSDIAETEAMFKTPPPRERRTAEQVKAGIQRAMVSFKEKGGRPGVSDPTQDGEWGGYPVSAWCHIANKDYTKLTDGTLYKLAGIFQQVGAITDSSPGEVAQAIEAFPELHDWWKEYDWPTDTFCQRLGGMLMPDMPGPEQPTTVTFAEPEWLGVSV